jgi:hypothetical protein
MTLLIAGIFSVLSFTFSSMYLQTSHAQTDRVRAQAAADAAALAAVAEGTIYGSASPAEMARQYAERNGADLKECICPPGAYLVQVQVQVGGSRATAAAEIDPTLLMPASVSSAAGLNPQLAAAVDSLVRASQGSVHLVSGFRSSNQQTLLWNQALAKYGSPEAADDWVAPPGHSMHERGLAVDLGGDLSRAVALIDSLDLPLYRPLANEPWHFELVGTRR